MSRSNQWWEQRQREKQLDSSHNKKHARLRAEKRQQRPECGDPADVANFTHTDIAYLVGLTGVDCVRLHGSPERELRNTAQRVHAKLKQIECSRYNKGAKRQ